MTIWINEKLGVSSYYTDLNQDIFRLDVRDLVDGKGNDLNILQSKIKTGARMIRESRKVVVCCDRGISRSVAVSIGILCLLGKSFDDSLELVATKVKDQSLNLDLLEDIRKCIDLTAKNSKGSKKSKILVTGSTGFIGKTLVEKLSDNYSLFCPKRNEIDLTRDILSLYREVRNKEIGLIIHLAHPRVRNSAQSLAESILMMRNILEVSRLNDIPLIYLSTLVIFEGYYDISYPLTSDLKPKPRSIYGQSKALCEELIRLYRDLYGLKITILRPSYVYGRGMDKTTFLWKFITNALRDEPIIVHQYLNGFQQFDFLYIDDVVDAIEHSISLTPSEDINLGTGKGVSTLDIAKLIIGLTASKSKINIVNVKDYVTNLIPDPRKAQEMLNWQAKTELTYALESMIAFVKSQMR